MQITFSQKELNLSSTETNLKKSDDNNKSPSNVSDLSIFDD